MVLIDAWSPDLFTPAPEVITQSLPLAKAIKTAAPPGQLRLFGELGILNTGKAAEIRPAAGRVAVLL